MVEPVNSIKDLVEHIANGRLSELCLLCLIPLEANHSESIFTLICKEDTEYCVADALEAVCQFELHRSENYNICIDCFKSASEAYKFHLRAKRSMELITYYIHELLNNVNNIEITGEDTEKLLFVPLPEYSPTTRIFDFNLDGIGKFDGNVLAGHSISKGNDLEHSISDNDNIMDSVTDGYEMMNNDLPDGNDMRDGNIDDIGKLAESNNLSDTASVADHNSVVDYELNETETNSTDENIILVVKDKKQTSSLDNDDSFSMHSSDDDMVIIVNEKKVRKKRDPMVYMECSQCPIKYRFVAKLKDHMKTVHNIDLYYCKICKIITEHKQEYEKHLKTHTGKHQCTICNIVYKKPDTLVTHMKLHKKAKYVEQVNQLKHVNICEQCGDILENEASLEKHMKNKHAKRYTCYYCGRMYRLEGSFEGHIRKHEEYWNKKKGSKSDESSSKKAEQQANKLDKSKRSICQTCGKDFIDERSLLWHQRLHSNDRPYICDVCGRGFVNKNRRNQHCLCAHTPPQRRCPLCPALFHLRSMVNTHVKKVHLTAHKRRNRTSKHKNVFWRTQAVPIQELSIDVQNDVLELKAAQGEKLLEPEKEIHSTSISLFVE